MSGELLASDVKPARSLRVFSSAAFLLSLFLMAQAVIGGVQPYTLQWKSKGIEGQSQIESAVTSPYSRISVESKIPNEIFFGGRCSRWSFAVGMGRWSASGEAFAQVKTGLAAQGAHMRVEFEGDVVRLFVDGQPIGRVSPTSGFCIDAASVVARDGDLDVTWEFIGVRQSLLLWVAASVSIALAGVLMAMSLTRPRLRDG